MIKISKKAIISLVALILGLFACCFILAFFVSENQIQRWMLFGTFFFGFGSISISVSALAISIKSFINTENEKRRIVKQDANGFLIENNEEIEYMPLCLIAYIYDCHRKYKRKIYTSFCKLSSDVRSEVLKQLNYNTIKISNKNWLRDSLESIKSFVEKYEFGSDALFGYYEKLLNYSDDDYGIGDADINIISSRYLGAPSLRFENGECYDNGITFRKYADLYLHARLNNDLLLKFAPKPLDELILRAQLTESDEKSICFWTVYVVDVIADIIKLNPRLKLKDGPFPKVHAEIITSEDRFLLSLVGLFDLSNYVEVKE